MKKYIGKTALFVAGITASLSLHLSAEAASYTVVDGDSVFSIAADHGIDPYDLASANAMEIDGLIVPGQVLDIPGYEPVQEAVTEDVSVGSDYTVQAGDSLYGIADTFSLNIYDLLERNHLDMDSIVHPGQVLQLTQNIWSQPLTASVDNSYYLPGYEYEPGINYPVGQCTWGVQKVAPWAGDWWGDAATWGANAARDGFRTGTSPEVGAIISWNDGNLGHVAYVTGVNEEGQIQVLEANYRGQQWVDNFRGWFNPTDTIGEITYIYND